MKFKYLVAADGAKRSLVKEMGEKEVFFDKTQKPLHHTKHVVATFRLPIGTTPKTCSQLKVHVSEETGTAEPVVLPEEGEIPERQIEPCPMSEIRKYGWTGHTRPHSQIYATRDVIYIGAEMPPILIRSRHMSMPNY